MILTNSESKQLRESCFKYLTKIFKQRKTRETPFTSGVWSSANKVNLALYLNCLPGHLMILPDVERMGKFQKVTVVVGRLCKKNTECELNKEDLHEIFTNKIWPYDIDISDKTRFHAWIQVEMYDGTLDIIDIIGPVNRELEEESFFDKEIAAKHDLAYFPVLTKREEVLEFHSKLAFARYTKDRQGVVRTMSYLTQMAHHLDEEEDIVLGTEGRYLTSLVSPNAHRGERVLIGHLPTYKKSFIYYIGAKVDN